MSLSSPINNGKPKKYDHLVKIIVIGDKSVGKSQMISRKFEDKFQDNIMPTLGVSSQS